MREPDTTRLFVDDAVSALVAAEIRVASLEQDVEAYKQLLRDALKELHSANQLNRRLMYRIEKARG